MRITQSEITPTIQKIVEEGFAKHSLETVGFDGGMEPFAFTAWDGETFAGIIACRFFLGSTPYSLAVCAARISQ